MSKICEANISICDPLNPGFGYQVRIENNYGQQLLFTSVDPITGEDLKTFGQALTVLHAYMTPIEAAVLGEQLFNIDQEPA